MRPSFFPVAIVMLALAAVEAPPQEKAVPNEIPRDWSMDQIARATPPYGVESRVYVLAWQVREDDRPLRVEQCLVLRAPAAGDNEGSWSLAHLYRHPGDKQPQWQLSMTHVTGEKGTKFFTGLWLFHSKHFKHRPSNQEVYATLASMEEVDWRFAADRGWKLVRCAVCEKSWREAIGEPPTRFFGD